LRFAEAAPERDGGRWWCRRDKGDEEREGEPSDPSHHGYTAQGIPSVNRIEPIKGRSKREFPLNASPILANPPYGKINFTGFFGLLDFVFIVNSNFDLI